MKELIESYPAFLPLALSLPLVACIGLVALVVLCERSRAFAQFVKYGAIGVVATYVQTFVFYLLASTCLMCLGSDDWAVKGLGLASAEVTDGVRALRFAAATACGFVVANLTCWLLNRAFVFKPGKFRWLAELALFFAASTAATLIALLASAALIRWAGLMTSIAVLVEIAVSFCVNYFARRFFIFKG